MNPILNKNIFLVKEHIGILKASNSFDIYDPQTQQVILECREERLGYMTKILRFSDFKRMTPFEIDIKLPGGKKLITIKRGVRFILSNVQVLDENDQLIGRFKQKFFTIGGKFEVLDANGQFLSMLKGNLIGWDFKFISSDKQEFATVTKKWTGLGKEFFTSADNYVLQISDRVPENHPLRRLILAAVMCIDLVLKE